MSNVPPFPDDIPVALFDTISLERFQDLAEQGKLFRACKKEGFFYLDLQGDEELTRLLDMSYGIVTEIMDWPDEQKRKYESDDRVMGYKGTSKTKIRAELMKIPRQNLSSFLDLPKERQLILERFTASCRRITNLVIDSINNMLKLPQNTLANVHDDSHKLTDALGFTKATPGGDTSESFNMHTDHGSVTLVFNRGLGGLQVPQPNKSGKMEWVYVKPLPGHAIVNLGNAMKIFSNDTLRSAVHRVVDPPGEQASCTRYSMMYFATPGEEVRMRSLHEVGDDGPTYAEFCTERLEKPNGIIGNGGIYGERESRIISG